VSDSAVVVWDDALVGYDFGPGHPLAPVRVELTMALADSLGVLLPAQMLRPEPADDHLLDTVHRPDYVAAVRRAGGSPIGADPAHGLGPGDNPVFAGMHEVSALVAGASVAAARAVREGAQHAVNIAGGLHHAMPDHASGFCIYNDPALAIRWLLDHGVGRVAYVDVDVHHGDGVQAMFYDEPRVLTISLHESGRTLFPGTGWPAETGAGAAVGSAVNVALPAGTGDRGWLRAFFAVVPPLVRVFRPEVLVSQHGCDSHALDPLAHLMLTVDGQRRAYAALHELAHEVCAGRWVVTGGGGYELVQVVPRAWTHLLAEVTGAPLNAAGDTPADWRELVASRTGEVAPASLSDGASAQFHRYPEADDELAGTAVDQAVAATRAAVFALHGLDPAAP
jgi:acetoin utilization protein AcuC